ncbi:MAG TPA: ABC transporter ATP-binding protein [Dongiaceae bacterium]|nr:ABC transporter ATP-binding protein [Dongiaceae bacterium]
MSMLTVEGLRAAYGAVQAVRGIDLAVEAGQIAVLLGPNGAGKSSTLRALMGLAPQTAGRITFDGRTILGLPPERIVRLGMTLVPEGRRVFADLTVDENLVAATTARRDRAAIAADRRQIFELFPVLHERLTQKAGSLSGGEQQQLALARALLSAARLLLLDEPSLGLAPMVVDAIFDRIVELRRRGLTILLVEQNVDRALDIADRGYVMTGGQIALAGTAAELRRSEGVERAYLGLVTA